MQNWPLANYELTQIRVAIADVKRFYANNGGSNMSVMTQAADDLDDAIKAKDSAKFVSAYAKLTAGCNACHEQTGFGFIKIREPRLSPLETSPFTDKSFSGKSFCLSIRGEPKATGTIEYARGIRSRASATARVAERSRTRTLRGPPPQRNLSGAPRERAASSVVLFPGRCQHEPRRH